MGGWAMSWLAHRLKSAGWQTASIAYHSMAEAPDRHVERLAAAVASIRGSTVHLLGHSMGGIIVLRYLQAGADSRVRRALLLGTPAAGCEAARLFERQPWGGALLGRSLELWQSPFAERIESEVEVGAIAGSEPFGLGPLFVHLAAPSDGVVRVEETRIAGLRDHVVLPVSHTGMLISNDVAAQAATFLGKGRFIR
jgi:pimeloyl-ACP methyl ester carboxylesterase